MARTSFKLLVQITTATCFALILVGAIVRATGSGLGCPDWPKCFGQWIPPLEVSELPSNYRDIFTIQGRKIAPFSAFKTWTEYLNRLLGVVVGMQVFAIMVTAVWGKLQRRKTLSISLFLLVGIQGWLGSLVVSSHLSSSLITLHMLVAMVILFLLVELWLRERKLIATHDHRQLKMSYGILLAMALIQLVLGSQSREQIDHHLHAEYSPPRAQWYSSLEGVFQLHHFWAYILLGIFILHLWRYRDVIRSHGISKTLATFISGVMLSQLLSGMVFKYLDFPAANQPLHLFLASLLIALLFAGFRLYHHPLPGALVDERKR